MKTGVLLLVVLIHPLLGSGQAEGRVRFGAPGMSETPPGAPSREEERGGPSPGAIERLGELLGEAPSAGVSEVFASPIVVPVPGSAYLLAGALVTLAALGRLSRSKARGPG